MDGTLNNRVSPNYCFDNIHCIWITSMKIINLHLDTDNYFSSS